MHMGHSEFRTPKNSSGDVSSRRSSRLDRYRSGRGELKAAKGQPLLEVAVHAGINIEHACGGVCACSTCHVYVTQGMSDCSEAEEDEEDRVEEAQGSRSTRVFAAKRSSKGMVRSSCTFHRGIATR